MNLAPVLLNTVSQREKIRILIVDDTPDSIRVLLNLLRDEYSLIVATNAEKGFFLASAHPQPDIILLDVDMPGMNGYELCSKLKEHEETRRLPVIFVTGLNQEQNERKGLSLGAVDYIAKPFNPHLVRARIQNQVAQKRNRDLLENLVTRRTRELESVRGLLQNELSERFRMENSFQNIAGVVNDSPIGMVVLNEKMVIDWANPHFFLLVEKPAEEVLKGCWDGLGLREEQPDGSGSFHLAFVKGERWSGEFELTTPSEKTDRFRAAFYPLSKESRLHGRYVGMLEKVSEACRIEGDFRHSQRIEAIGTLTSRFVHDFRNILGIIHGNNELLQMELDGDEKKGVLLGEVRKAVRVGDGLAKRILEFVRKQDIRKERTDLNECVRNFSSFFHRILPDSIALKVMYSPFPLWIMADQTSLDQVLLNLLTNARDSMPDGGTVEIALNISLGSGYTRPKHLDASEAFAVLAFSDSGCGIDQRTMEKLFEPFFSTKEPGKGTGLGLSTIKEILNMLGAGISVQSEVGKGTTFEVWFPLIEKKTLSLSYHQ